MCIKNLDLCRQQDRLSRSFATRPEGFELPTFGSVAERLQHHFGLC